MKKTPSLVRRERRGDLPLSFAQTHLWLLDQLGAGAAFNIPMALRLSGRLDVAGLAMALEAMAGRHETLRTAFAVVGAEPVQRVLASVKVSVERVDLTEVAPEEREAAAIGRAREEASRPFDLTAAPLFRVLLLRLEPEEHVLVITMHHTITDGYSMERLFLAELGRCYEAACRGVDPQLPELEIQYGDFAVWQRECFEADVLAMQLAFWKQQLADIEPLELPSDRPRPAVKGFNTASFPFAIPAAVRDVGRSQGYTPAMVLLATWQLLLARYGGEDDVAVGTLNSSRRQAEIEPLIGNFARTLVLRTSFAGNPRFTSDVLPRIRESWLSAFENQDIPFEKIVEELNPRRDTSRHPFFQVMFGMQYVPDERWRLGEIEIRALRLPNSGTGLDLDLRVLEEGGQLAGQLIYDVDLFDASTIERMTGHFVQLLEGIVARPDARLSELSLLTDEERRCVLEECNDTSTGPASGVCIHELFERQVDATPTAVALIGEEGERTYAWLEARANRIAHVLRDKDVGVGDTVGLCMERGTDTVASLLGILKAGAAYVPLDPINPPQRQAYLLEDARPRVVLTEERFLQDLPSLGSGRDAERLCLERLTDAGTETRVTGGARDTDPAYVIYTSGSTGSPKGVVGSHRAMVNRIQWQWSADPWAAGEVACHKTNLSFVDAVNEIFGAVCAGIPLVLVSYARVTDTIGFVEVLAEHRVTRLVLVPSHLEAVLDIFDDLDARLPALTRWTVSGEALSGRLAARFFEAMPRATLWNLYGSTEVAADATLFEVKREELDVESGVPIGRPIANLRCYVLDRWNQPVPVGIPGELVVGGRGVARGYLNRDELTAEAFLPDTFGHPPGGRLYRTGDVVRRRADGVLEYLGRRDHRVKLRGMRIELGEVEAVMASHPGVSRAVTVKRDERLVCYVVPGNGDVSTRELQAYIGERLPAYMVPATFVVLEELPRTPSGKVDRKALPAPDPELEAGSRRTFVAPRDTLELQLTQILEGVLDVRGIGIDDDFFELGGHSLLVVRLFDRIDKLLGQRLPPITFFAAPTVRQLAEVLREDGWSPPWSSLVGVQPEGAKPPFFCVPPSVGVLEFFELARHFPKDRPLYGFEPRGLQGEARPHTRVEDMAAYYLAEMRKLQPEGPYHLGGQSFGGVVALEMAQQLLAQGQEVGRLVILDTLNPPRLSSPPKTFERLVKRSAFHLRHRQLTGFVKVNFRKAVRLTRRRMLLQSKPRPLRRVLIAHLRARRVYGSQVHPGGITLIQSEEGARFGNHEQWAEVCQGGVERHVLPGTHLDLVRDPNARAVAEEIARCLDESRA